MKEKDFFSNAFEEVKNMMIGYFLSNKVLYQDVEELVNEVFILAWEYRKTLRDQNKIKNWLFSIAKNVLRQYKNHLKKQKYMLKELNENITAEVRENNDEDIELALSLIEKLPNKYRDVFILHYVEEKSLKEISQILNISETNCKVRLLRAREKLQKLLEEKVSNYITSNNLDIKLGGEYET